MWLLHTPNVQGMTPKQALVRDEDLLVYLRKNKQHPWIITWVEQYSPLTN